MALLRARANLCRNLKGANEDQSASIQIVLRHRRALRQIVTNAGDEPSWW